MDACNIDPSSISLYLCHLNTDPGTTSNYQQYACGAYGDLLTISAKGGIDKVRYTKEIDIVHLVGGVDVSTDDSFRAIVTAVPTDLVYFGMGIGTISGANFNGGVAFGGYIEMDVGFYGRKNTLTT
jgi:hypothetical protein